MEGDIRTSRLKQFVLQSALPIPQVSAEKRPKAWYKIGGFMMKDIEYYREQIIKGLRGSGFLIPCRYATIIRLQRRHRRRLVFHLLDMFLMFHCSLTQHFLTANPLLTPVHWGATFHQVASHLFYDCTQLNNTRWEWWKGFWISCSRSIYTRRPLRYSCFVYSGPVVVLWYMFFVFAKW